MRSSNCLCFCVRFRVLWGLAALLPLLLARPAAAQTPSPLAEWQYSAGIQLQRLFEPTIPTWQTELGVGTQLAPISDGLERYTVQPGPVVDVRYKDIAFASTGEGIGVNLFSFSHVRVGAAITYDLGRPVGSYASWLKGLPTVRPAAETKFFADWALARSFPLDLRIDVRKQFGATHGWIGDVGLYTPLPGSSKHFAWFAGPSMTVANARYMQGYFGVSDYQSLVSRFRPYDARSGLKSIGGGFTAAWLPTPHWIFNCSAAADRLMGSAAESPITQDKVEGVFSTSVMYKF